MCPRSGKQTFDGLDTEIVRAMLLLRANTLALGHSGCRPELVDRLLAFLALGIHPVVPAQGSVGASGDLAPLAHLALTAALRICWRRHQDRRCNGDRNRRENDPVHDVIPSI